MERNVRIASKRDNRKDTLMNGCSCVLVVLVLVVRIEVGLRVVLCRACLAPMNGMFC